MWPTNLLIIVSGVIVVIVKGAITPQSSSVKGTAGQTVTIQWTYDTTGQIALIIDYKTPSGVYKTIASGAQSDSTLTIASNYKPFDPRLIVSKNSVNKVTATISGLKCEDEGNFMLKLVPSSETSEISLSVQVLPDGTPTITQSSGSLVEGQNATFTCKAHLGKPAGTIEWYKNSNKVTTAATLTKSTNSQYSCSEDGTSTLVVALDTTDNVAVYKCQVVPDASLTVTSPPMKEFTALDVKLKPTTTLPPTITSPLSTTPSKSSENPIVKDNKVRFIKAQTGTEVITASEGSKSVTLDCTAMGNPLPSYLWTSKGSPITGAFGATYTTSLLALKNNEYECTATNTVQGQTFSVYKKFVLKVTDKRSDKGAVSDSTGTIVGSIVGVLAAVALGLLLLFIWRKRKQRNDTRENAAYELPKITRKQSGNYTSLNKFEVAASDVSLDDKLGEGNFGEVWKGTYTDNMNKTTVAVKRLKATAEEQDHKDFKNELNIMKNIDPHPNMIKLIGYCCQEPVLILLEYMEQGDLKKYLQDSRGRHIYGNLHGNSQSVTQENLVSFSLDIAHGMEHIANRKLLHRDLAARNVLLTKDNVCKISDFGSTKDVQNSREYESKIQRPLPIRWMAPESLHDSIYTTKSDVWSYGVLLYEIFTLGATPYPGMSGHTVMKEVKKGFRMDCPTHCDDKLYTIMHQCWKEDPDDRPTFTELSQIFLQIKSENYNYIDLTQISENIYEEINRSEDEKM